MDLEKAIRIRPTVALAVLTLPSFVLRLKLANNKRLSAPLNNNVGAASKLKKLKMNLLALFALSRTKME